MEPAGRRTRERQQYQHVPTADKKHALTVCQSVFKVFQYANKQLAVQSLWFRIIHAEGVYSNLSHALNL